MITPNVRRALHQALDLVLDALAEDEAGRFTKGRRAPAEPKLPEIELTPEASARARTRLERAGLKRTG